MTKTYSLLLIPLFFLLSCSPSSPTEKEKISSDLVTDSTVVPPTQTNITEPTKEKQIPSNKKDTPPSKSQNTINKTSQLSQKGIPQADSRIFKKTFDAGSFAFHVNAQNGEQSKIHVYSERLPRAYDQTFEIEATLKEAHLLDLNKDGFKELYLVIQPTGDSGNLEVMGIASYRDRSAGNIIVKDTKEVRKVYSDKVYVSEGQLLREFIQRDDSRQFVYKLDRGETGFVLTTDLVKR